MPKGFQRKGWRVSRKCNFFFEKFSKFLPKNVFVKFWIVFAFFRLYSLWRKNSKFRENMNENFRIFKQKLSFSGNPMSCLVWYFYYFVLDSSIMPRQVQWSNSWVQTFLPCNMLWSDFVFSKCFLWQLYST